MFWLSLTWGDCANWSDQQIWFLKIWLEIKRVQFIWYSLAVTMQNDSPLNEILKEFGSYLLSVKPQCRYGCQGALVCLLLDIGKVKLKNGNWSTEEILVGWCFIEVSEARSSEIILLSCDSLSELKKTTSSNCPFLIFQNGFFLPESYWEYQMNLYIEQLYYL